VTRYRLSPKAVEDLSDIWDYTAWRWSADQAGRYTRGIHEACEALASGGQRGQDAGHVRRGYRKQSVGRHVLYFRVARDGGIEIVRILHQRMDVARHL
jgi:toxin ParE1/3/4